MASPSDPSLGVRAARGAAWLATSSTAGQVIALGTTVVLARLLQPGDFGLVALANLLLAFVGPLHDSGLATAFVARREEPRAYAATLSWGTATSGLVAGVLTAAAAPLVARAFDNAALEPIARALALTFVFRGLAASPLAVLTRELAFQRRAAIALGATVVESGVGIALAFAGYGAWSLVGGQLCGAATTAAMAWIVVPWRPLGRYSSARLWEMSRYGRHVVAGNSLGFLGAYLDNIVVGRVLGVDALGIYGAAFRWGRLPAVALSTVVSPVAFPSYVAVRDDAERLRRAYLRLVRTITSVTIPAQTGLYLLAPEFVHALYPPAWDSMVTPLRIFAVFGLVNSVVATTGDVFKATERPGWIAALAGVHLPTLVVMLWLLVGRGAAGAAAALTIAAVVSGAVAVPIALRALALPLRRLAAALAPQAIATVAMTLALGAAKLALAQVAPAVAVGVLVPAGITAYLVTLAVLDVEWMRELAGTFRLTFGRGVAA